MNVQMRAVEQKPDNLSRVRFGVGAQINDAVNGKTSAVMLKVYEMLGNARHYITETMPVLRDPVTNEYTFPFIEINSDSFEGGSVITRSLEIEVTELKKATK
jgi:hypothetical protein